MNTHKDICIFKSRNIPIYVSMLMKEKKKTKRKRKRKEKEPKQARKEGSLLGGKNVELPHTPVGS